MKAAWISSKRSPEDDLAFMRSQLEESTRILNEQELLMEKRRQHNQAMIHNVEELTKRGRWGLKPHEVWWKDRTELLQSHGFLLQERLRPDWKPSWLGTPKHPGACEDGHPLPFSAKRMIRATRASDGKLVMIRKVRKGSRGAVIPLFLSSEHQRGHEARNPCVPILEYFEDNSDTRLSFIVMPTLHPIKELQLSRVSEVLYLITQTLQGLDFLHALGIAHREISSSHIMYEMVDIQFNSENRMPIRKSQTFRYYLVDFGMSIVKPLSPAEHSLGKKANFQKIWDLEDYDDHDPNPEWEENHSPFPADILALGLVYKQELIQRYRNLHLIRKVVRSMIKKNPEHRPTATQALAQVERVTAGQRPKDLDRALRRSVWFNSRC